jgi:hypothetical protein
MTHTRIRPAAHLAGATGLTALFLLGSAGVAGVDRLPVGGAGGVRLALLLLELAEEHCGESATCVRLRDQLSQGLSGDVELRPLVGCEAEREQL